MNFDRAGLPPNGTQALRQEPRTRVQQTGSCRRYPIRGQPSTSPRKRLEPGK
jgi:hypothetical protein